MLSIFHVTLLMKTFGIFLLCLSVIDAAPLATIHVKFISPPHVYEHALTTDGGSTISQKSYLAIGKRQSAFGDRLPGFFTPARGRTAQQAESLQPVGLFYPPEDVNDLGYSSQDAHTTPDFSNGLEYPDDFLLTGETAALAVKYLYGRGELFYNDIPHARALLRNQEERHRNGLHGNILSSLRTSSPFFNRF